MENLFFKRRPLPPPPFFTLPTIAAADSFADRMLTGSGCDGASKHLCHKWKLKSTLRNLPAFTPAPTGLFRAQWIHSCVLEERYNSHFRFRMNRRPFEKVAIGTGKSISGNFSYLGLIYYMWIYPRSKKGTFISGHPKTSSERNEPLC